MLCLDGLSYRIDIVSVDDSSSLVYFWPQSDFKIIFWLI